MSQNPTVSFKPEEYTLFLCGGLLGDSTLQKRGESYRYRIHHCARQKELVEWKHEKLRRLCKTTKPPYPVVQKGYLSYEFYCTSSISYKPMFDLFYQPEVTAKGVKNVKRITPRLLNELPKNPLVLAVWYLDDGTVRDDCYAGRFATQCFSYQEHVLLRQYLQDVYQVSTNICYHLERKDQFYLAIPAASFGHFVSLVEPWVKQVPTLSYKLNEKRIVSSKIV